MTDEEYASYVRQAMYLRTHEHILLERQRHADARARQKETEKQKEAQARKWDFEIAEALKRGEQRRRRGRWNGIWEKYLRSWTEEHERDEDDVPRQKKRRKQSETEKVEDVIIWPVASGMRHDVSVENVEEFFRRAPQAGAGSKAGEGEVDIGAILKTERVRWHPDKMQQRAIGAGRGEGLGAETMRVVTAVWQVIDRMWVELRSK
ncbi:MAG: hypothetical protein Q9190_004067 [Brigantiaea leucoxantha]